MPKRGSLATVNTATAPRKRQKNTQSTNGYHEEGYDENTPLNQSSYSSQLFKKGPDVCVLVLVYRRRMFFVFSCIKMLEVFFELV